MLTELVHQKSCKENKLITDLHTDEIACSNCGASHEKSVGFGPKNLGLANEVYLTTSTVGMKTSLNMADRGLSSKNSMVITAATVHLVSQKNNEKISQLKISEASGIISVTIRDRVKEIKEVIGGEI